MLRPLNYAFLLVVSLLLTACGGSEDSTESAPAAEVDQVDSSQVIQDYYASKPEFFSFKTIADMPADLPWQDGSDLPDIGSSEAKKGGTEYARLADFPRTLRIAGPDANGSFRPYLLDYTTMPLANRHPNEFDFYPGLAKRWAVNTETKTIYIELFENAKWSDGAAITSDDFLYQFYFFQSPHIIAPWYNNWYSSQYTNITKYDDTHFSISIPEAKPDMDSRVLELRPMPEHFYKALNENFVEEFQWQFAPTTGPYILKPEDLKKGTSIVLTRDDNWWAKENKFWRNRFNMDRIYLSVKRDTSKVFEAFKRGDIDQFSLNLAEFWYDKLPNEDEDVTKGYIHKSVFYNQKPRPTWGLWINTSKPLVNDLNIRLGIQHASNWQLVIDKFFRGDYARMQTSSDGYGEFTHPELKARAYDIERAQAYFSKAGFKQRGDDGILINGDGQRLSLGLSSGSAAMKDSLTILKEEAAKAGLELRVEVLDSTAAWKKVQEKQHDIHFTALNVGLEMYPRFWETYHSDNAYDVPFLPDGNINPERKVKTQTNNMEVLSIPEMDQMINQYRNSEDKAEMKELAFKMTELHHQHASFVPAFFQPFYRVGHWRWLKYPDDFNAKYSEIGSQYFVHWIDTELKTATLEARKNGTSFPPEVNVYDQYK